MTVTLAKTYPLVAQGLARFTAYVNMTVDERSEYLATASPEELAALHVEVSDVYYVFANTYVKDIAKTVRDRFLAVGSDAFERAVRNHARESDVAVQAVNRMAAQCNATRPVAHWKKELAEREAYAENAERAAVEREAKALEQASAYAEMKNRHAAELTMLRKRMADGIIVPPSDEVK